MFHVDLGGAADRSINVGRTSDSHTSSSIIRLSSDVSDLRNQLARAALLNQALWELLQQHVGLTEAQLLEKVAEVDLRDGKQDGKLTERAVRCPQCQRVCNSRHAKCIYCGQEFETDVFNATGR